MYKLNLDWDFTKDFDGTTKDLLWTNGSTIRETGEKRIFTSSYCKRLRRQRRRPFQKLTPNWWNFARQRYWVDTRYSYTFKACMAFSAFGSANFLSGGFKSSSTYWRWYNKRTGRIGNSTRWNIRITLDHSIRSCTLCWNFTLAWIMGCSWYGISPSYQNACCIIW